MNNNKDIGNFFEQEAEGYLKRQGLKPLHRNFHSRFGEIDLIMLDKKTLCFIEVKARKNSIFGQPEEFVTPAKQKKIVLTAQYFLQTHKHQNADCRFDVIAITYEHKQSNINWLKNAFMS